MRSILIILVFLTFSFSCSKSDSINNTNDNSNNSSNVEPIPTTDFFGHKLNINSTPNIGASNAKNGEIIN